MKKKILIVDDSPGDRELLRILISKDTKQEDFEFFEADGVSTALEMIKDKTFYCCFVDYHLSIDTGIDFIKSIRAYQESFNIPIIFITGFGNEDMAKEALDYGAQDYIEKNAMTTEMLIHSIENSVRTYDLQQQLHRSAHYDYLTGLLNRGLFMNRLKKAIDDCKRYDQACSLLYVDLDDFKQINDTYGHEAGDYILKTVAERLQKNCRVTDSAARLGGDEFAILLERVDELKSNAIAAKLLDQVSKEVKWKSHKINISLSLGIAYYPKTANDIRDLLRQADEAMYMAKKSGKDNYCFFSRTQKKEWLRRCQLEKMLPLAIANNELSLRYQPIVNTLDQSLYGLETLSRWDIEGFNVSAGELIEMVDHLNLFDDFNFWLIRTALKQFGQWQKNNINLHLSLNVPASQHHIENIINYLHGQLIHHKVNPQLIELEITETTLMSQPELSKNILSSIQKEGVSIAIDDFGTGYSSMSYLTSLPVNTLKIDKSFVLGLAGNSKNKKVIEAITALAHSLDLKVVAEGVETKEAYEAIKNIGCDLIQGFYFGCPERHTTIIDDFVESFPNIKADDVLMLPYIEKHWLSDSEAKH